MAATLIRGTSGTRLCPLKLRSALKSTRLKSFSPTCKLIEIQSCTAVNSVKLSRTLSTSTTFHSESAAKTAPTDLKKQSETAEKDEDLYKEQYIPVTRQSIVRHIVQEKEFLTDEERKLFPEFVQALDSALMNKYHGVLQELKTLFDPINPDKDTMKTREWTKRDKLDNEFWLLQQLGEVMAKANFHELPKEKVERFLKEHESSGVRVKVDPSRYDVLRFWVLGHEIPELQLSLSERILNRLFRRPPRKPMEYFRRVVVALRLKKDSKLVLKAFKEVPVHDIEMLLPDGKIQMRPIDKTMLTTTAGLASFGVLAKAVTTLANYQVDWTLLLALLTGTVGVQVWSSYNNKRNAYLLKVSRMLYFKNMANNRGLLTLLVDRAEDESLKEAILTYAFLLSSDPVAYRNKSTRLILSEPSGLTEKELEDKVAKWLEKKTGVKVEFDSSEAVEILKNFGLLSEKNNKYHVLYLDSAFRILPQRAQSVITRRAAEADFTEGYDRDEYLETEEEYKSEDEKTKRYGWF